jgi:hypothetical protein
MKLKNQTFICLFFLISLFSFSQESINTFKYVSVPENYSFLKSKDQYQLNSLTIFLFEKNNFTVLNSLQNYPSDLAQNKCLLLNSDIIKIKGVFKTKLQLILTDCRENIIFTSEIGQSKLKDFKKAYQEALRNAFISVASLNYDYSGSLNSPKPPLPPVIDKGTNERKPPKPYAPKLQIEAQPKLTTTVPNSDTENKKAILGLIIKPTISGYDFIDNTTKKVMYSVQATMFENVYIIEAQSGIIYKRGNSWVREYYQQNKTIIEALNTLP